MIRLIAIHLQSPHSYVWADWHNQQSSRLFSGLYQCHDSSRMQALSATMMFRRSQRQQLRFGSSNRNNHTHKKTGSGRFFRTDSLLSAWKQAICIWNTWCFSHKGFLRLVKCFVNGCVPSKVLMLSTQYSRLRRSASSNIKLIYMKTYTFLHFRHMRQALQIAAG